MSIYTEYRQLCGNLKASEETIIPLCAAQTHISNFCKTPLISAFEGKYSFKGENGVNSFVDGPFIDHLNTLLYKQCKIIFNADYINADTLTGINCFTVAAMSLIKKDSQVLITTPNQGGHPSIPYILEELGIKYSEMPYDYSKYQIDYNEANKLLKSNAYDFVIFCQSDLINIPDLAQLSLSNACVIYDATQTLGLIAGKATKNPLNLENVVLIGGSHKTLPAPACGLIMTNNWSYRDSLESKISPHLLRNTQPNHIASLLLALIEQEKYGETYQSKVITVANDLGRELELMGFKLAKANNDTYTYTHQLFILMNEDETQQMYNNCFKYNISLNQKHKQLFGNHGIRIGTQQIARYNWQGDDLSDLALLLFYVFTGEHYHEEILEIRENLIQKKIPQFEYENIIIE